MDASEFDFSAQNESPTTVHCLKALEEGDISLRFVKAEWIGVDSSPLRSVNVFQRQCLQLLVLHPVPPLPLQCVCLVYSP